MRNCLGRKVHLSSPGTQLCKEMVAEQSDHSLAVSKKDFVLASLELAMHEIVYAMRR
jgi:hypothetical protein